MSCQDLSERNIFKPFYTHCSNAESGNLKLVTRRYYKKITLNSILSKFSNDIQKILSSKLYNRDARRLNNVLIDDINFENNKKRSCIRMCIIVI